jgi:single-stranded-DNA-specific exonuclease
LAGCDDLARGLRIAPLLVQVLHNRGLDDPNGILRFLNPKLTDLHPPELLPDIDKAAARLCRAIAGHESVCIYGDYDVDGMTAVAILYRFLAMHGAVVDFYVPHRLEEGYGVNQEAVEKIAGGGCKLLITVDCGVSAIGPLTRANELGMEVIVTDHHCPESALPPAVAVVHPGLPGGAYPNPNLSGAGVALKLAWHAAKLMSGGAPRVDERTRAFLLEATSLAALGIIADVVPLVGENRALAVYGLKGLPVLEHVGIKALIASAGLAGEKLDSFDVGFRLAPRLNACGRMGHAQAAVELLARADAARCREIAAHLEQANTQRQAIERDTLAQALELAGKAPTAAGLVLAGEGWHAGVVGIVASRLVEQFSRPVVMIALTGERGHGSCRSVSGFHMRDALQACAQHLLTFGGHAMAGGLTLERRNLEAFTAAFAAHAQEALSGPPAQRTLAVDAETTIAQLTLPLVSALEKLAPFGAGNPAPVVAIRGCRVLTPPRRMGRSGAAVSLLVDQPAAGGAVGGAGNGVGSATVNGTGAGPAGGNLRLRCVGFGMGDLADHMTGVHVIDIAGRPVVNTFNGRSSVEMHLQDVSW